MTKTFNWGIIGPGKIAHKFAEDLQLLKGAKLHAVASRSKERAKAFADRYGVTYAFGTYEDILSCPDLDAVYIATPHTSHFENTLMCLENSLPVLCEKPFAMNAKQVQGMIEAAHANGTFLMEALWTRFIPIFRKVVEVVESGKIGKIQLIKADFGFNAPFLPEKRIFNRALGGGSLLDVGIYPVFLALILLGKPQKIKAIASIGNTGVDESCGILFQYPQQQIAVLNSSIVAKTPTEAFIHGENGRIHLPSRFHEPDQMLLTFFNGENHHIQNPRYGNGYYYEALEVMQCVTLGKKESDLLPLKFSLDLIEILDAIRKEIGLTYPKYD